MTLEEIISSLKGIKYDLLISDLDGTLVKNTALAYFKYKFHENPKDTILFLFNEIPKYLYGLSKTAFCNDIHYNLISEYYESYKLMIFYKFLEKNTLYDFLNFVKKMKYELVLPSSRKIFYSINAKKRVLVTSNFYQTAELFNDIYSFDEIYDRVKNKDDLINQIIAKNSQKNVIILGDSFSDQRMYYSLLDKNIKVMGIFRVHSQYWLESNHHKVNRDIHLDKKVNFK